MSHRKSKSTTPSYIERLDPSGQMRQQVTELFDLANHPLIQSLGIPEDLIEQARNLPAEYDFRTNIEPVAVTLAPLGWCVFARADSNVYREAYELAKINQIQEADTLLVNHWNKETRLRIPELKIRSLYTKDVPPRLEISSARHQILENAYELHQSKEYNASIPMVLAQIDGICSDVTHKPAKKLFQKKFFQQRRNHLEDNRTIAGHRLGLASLSQVFSENTPETTLNTELLRHGIMHGRTLGFGTKVNSTKAFVALHALLEWAWEQVWGGD